MVQRKAIDVSLKVVAIVFLLFVLKASLSGASAVPDQFLVQLKKNKIQDLSDVNQLLFVQNKRRLGQSNIYLVEKNKIITDQFFLQAMQLNSYVELIEPNYFYQVSLVPNDPFFQRLWGLSNQGQPDENMQKGIAGIDIGAVEAWKITTGSRQVVVAVIDTGLDLAHPEFNENVWTNQAELNGKPGVDDDQNGYIDDIHGWNFVSQTDSLKDDMGHGTHVAGTIGARGDNQIGLVGVAWNVSLMPLKALDQTGAGTLAQAIEAIQYAILMKAQIINASWGSYEKSVLLEQTLQSAAEAGVLFVAAAGNDHLNNDNRPVFPASFDLENLLAVAAIDSRGHLAQFSNFGWKHVALAAPGVSILSAIPEGYKTYSGTSMAAPHVSGAAALLLSVEPQLTAQQVKDRLVQTAQPLSSLDGFVRAGLVKVDQALKKQRPERNADDAYFWQKKIRYRFSSEHPYLPNQNLEQVIEIPGAHRISIYFKKFETEKLNDVLTFYDRSNNKLAGYSGHWSGEWSVPIETDYLRVVFSSNNYRQAYGFDVTELAYQ